MEASPLWSWTETSIPPQAPPPVPYPTTELAAVTAGMRAGIQDEITATTREDTPRTELPTGFLIGRRHGPFPLYLYRFDTAPSWVRAGSCTNLVIAGRSLTTYAVSRHQGGALVIGVSEDLGPSVDHAELDQDAVWLLHALQTTLGQLSPGFNVPLALAAVGAAPVPSLGPDLEVEDLLPRISWELNGGQLDALRVGLRAPLGFIWGPPGTGKTQTLAALGDAHVAAGRRVLLLCPTNRSLDEGVARLAKRLKARSALEVGTVVRYGEMGARHRNCCGIPLEHGLLPPESVRTCQILAMTVHMAYLLPDLVAGFDAVIVDEAGAMTLPLAFWAAGLGRSRVTFLGDFCQLGPIVKSPTLAARRWLARDVFAASGVTGRVRADENPPYLGALHVQYRMDPPINHLVNRLYYKRLLEADTSVLRRQPLPCPLTEHAALTLVDTSAAEPQSRGANEVTSGGAIRLTNPVHARLVGRVLHHIATDAANLATGCGVSVVVLAPYRAQVDLHRRTWGETYGGLAVAATVHAIQGGEVDTVILDLTDAPPNSVSPFFQGKNSEECARLLNVAVSRARRRVIVLGNVQWLMKKASAPVRDLLADLREHAYRLPLRDLR